MFLLDFIKTLLPHIKKSEVVEDLRITKNELATITIPSANQGAEFFKLNKNMSSENKDLSKKFYAAYHLAGSGNRPNFIAEIALRLPTVLQNLDFIDRAIDEELGEDVIVDGITAKKALLVRSAEEISFISRFTMDLLLLVYSNENAITNSEGSVEMQVSSISAERIIKSIAVYARVLSVLGDKDYILEKRFKLIPEVLVSDATVDSIIAAYSEKDIDPVNTIGLRHFEYSPIYHIRMLFAEWQADRYRNMKDKKQSLELRLLLLKLQVDKKSDPKLEKEIIYLQSRIEALEYKMAKASE